MTTMTLAGFPSVDWFQDLIDRSQADGDEVQRLGIAELRFGMEILAHDGSRQLFGLILDGYDVAVVAAPDEAALRAEVIMSGALTDWLEMIASIEETGGADNSHSLNTLTIGDIPFTIRADDAMGQDKFYRFMGTLQHIFDAAGAAQRSVGGS